MSENMYLEISDTCMYHCSTCPKGQHDKKKKGYFPSKEEVIKSIYNAGKDIKSVTLSGGEPLLNPYLYDILSAFEKMRLSVTLLSNLYLVGQLEMVEKLKIFKNNLMIVTALHSKSPDVHDRITGINGSFQKTTSAVTELVKAGIHVTIKIILSNENSKELTEMFEDIVSRWGKKVRIHLCGLDLCGVPRERRNLFPLDYRFQAEQLEKFLTKAEEFYKNSLEQFIAVSEYPLCCVDPYFWRLVHKSMTDYTVYIAKNSVKMSEKLRRENQCYPHAENCRNCVAYRICPGIWYSVYENYGENIVMPYGK